MSDRDTLLKIFKIMRRLLLVSYDPVGPIPRKGTTRHECYRALYEIQNLLHTNMFFATLPPQTNYDHIVSKTPEELAEWIAQILTYHTRASSNPYKDECDTNCPMYWCCNDQPYDNMEGWLQSPADKEGDNG